jgi:hypothetical protein
VPGQDTRLHNTTPLRHHQALQAQVVRDGQPLAGLPVEPRHDQARFNPWQVSAPPRPLYADTIADQHLAAAQHRPAPACPRSWQLAEPLGQPGVRRSALTCTAQREEHGRHAAVQNGAQDSPKARSANQAAANKAINTEPPTITPHR